MKVAVTGGAGFIGSWVCDELAHRGHEPLIFDHLGRYYSDYDYVLGSVRDHTAVHELAAHVDGVIHLAAVLGTQETIRNPRPAFETNVLGGLNVLTACDLYQLPLVNIAVGNHWMLNSYSISKSSFERTVAMYQQEHDLPVANVRAVNAYGPRQKAAPPFAPPRVRKILPAFICRALTGQAIEVYGNGRQVSDCVWVGDVARALVTALELCAAGTPPPVTVEVGPTEHKTVNDVALMVAKACAPYTGDGSGIDVVHLPMRPGEIPGSTVTADTSTLAHVSMSEDDLLPLELGIRRTVEWFAENEGVTWHRPRAAA